MVQIVDKEVGQIGFGLMGLTWRPNPTPYEEAFKTMRAALEAGANCWNGGELYGPIDANSLQLLSAYFDKYPEDGKKVVLNIKGGLKPGSMTPDGGDENVQRSIDECLKHLQNKVKLDMFECARVDPNTPIETTAARIQANVDQGKVGGVALSEVSAQTIRKAAAVAKIRAVEVEFNMLTTDILTNGVAQACAELDIPILAYSPLGSGLLTGTITSDSQVSDHLKTLRPRLQGENLQANLKLVRKVQEFAKAKDCTPAQVAVAWVAHMSRRNGLPTIIPIPGATSVSRVHENTKLISLSEAEMKTIDEILASVTVSGGRFGGGAEGLLNG